MSDYVYTNKMLKYGCHECGSENTYGSMATHATCKDCGYSWP